MNFITNLGLRIGVGSSVVTRRQNSALPPEKRSVKHRNGATAIIPFRVANVRNVIQSTYGVPLPAA